jgi:tripartite-type tricarboxylate transporter receptor subunit TctC
MLGGEVDFMPTGISAAVEQIKAGNTRALAVLNTEEVGILFGVLPVTDAILEMDRFLPWGPFYGVFVRRDVSEDVIAKLVDAYSEATTNPAFNELMEGRGDIVLNISGAEADEFLKRWQ